MDTAPNLNLDLYTHAAANGYASTHGAAYCNEPAVHCHAPSDMDAAPDLNLDAYADAAADRYASTNGAANGAAHSIANTPAYGNRFAAHRNTCADSDP